MPKVSVIMPVKNAEKYVGAAVNSILNQSFKDFELLVLDDGSTDGSVKILSQFQERDKRVRLIEGRSEGIVRSLNHLISQVFSPLVARMDADDICLPTRLAEQVDYMDSNIAVGVCGSWVETFGGVEEVWHFRREDNFSRNLMFFGVTTVSHPTWMVRRPIYECFRYNEAFESIEDREWLARVAAHNRDALIANIPKVLLRYRLHNMSVTFRNKNKQIFKTSEIIRRLFNDYGINIEERELSAFHDIRLRSPRPSISMDEYRRIYQKIMKLALSKIPDEFYVFSEFWYKFCSLNGLSMHYRSTDSPGFSFI